jgi:hypothetical protein
MITVSKFDPYGFSIHPHAVYAYIPRPSLRFFIFPFGRPSSQDLHRRLLLLLKLEKWIPLPVGVVVFGCLAIAHKNKFEKWLENDLEEMTPSILVSVYVPLMVFNIWFAVTCTQLFLRPLGEFYVKAWHPGSYIHTHFLGIVLVCFACSY